jgi:uncharacterized coiled-coil protein SlyX
MGKQPRQQRRTLTPEAKRYFDQKAFVEAADKALLLVHSRKVFKPDDVWADFVEKLAVKHATQLPSVRKGIARSADVSHFLNKLKIQLELEALIYEPEGNEILLNEDWRGKASTYVAHIRTLVMKATLQEGLRERITRRLSDLQREIDRNRTKTASVTEVFLSLTEAVQKGAKDLVPAVRLFERLAGALSGARNASHDGPKTLRLPRPETLGLADLAQDAERAEQGDADVDDDRPDD